MVSAGLQVNAVDNVYEIRFLKSVDRTSRTSKAKQSTTSASRTFEVCRCLKFPRSLREIFAEIDTDCSNMITLAELKVRACYHAFWERDHI